MSDAAAQLRAAMTVAIAAMSAVFAVHVVTRLNDILTILEGMQ